MLVYCHRKKDTTNIYF